MIEPTIRTPIGCVDIIPFLRRDATGDHTIEVPTWERRPAALALIREGWMYERISKAVGLNASMVAELAGEK